MQYEGNTLFWGCYFRYIAGPERNKEAERGRQREKSKSKNKKGVLGGYKSITMERGTKYVTERGTMWLWT